MSDIENTMSTLTKMVVEKRVQGYTFDEISEDMGIPSADVVKTWKTYVDSRTEMSQEESWVLHLLRLEKLLTHVQSLAMAGNDAENIDNMLKLLDRIEALQALNKTRKTEADNALVELTRQQTHLILTAMLNMQANMRNVIETALENKTIKAIRNELIGNYDDWFIEEAQKALSITAGE